MGLRPIRCYYQGPLLSGPPPPFKIYRSWQHVGYPPPRQLEKIGINYSLQFYSLWCPLGPPVPPSYTNRNCDWHMNGSTHISTTVPKSEASKRVQQPASLVVTVGLVQLVTPAYLSLHLPDTSLRFKLHQMYTSSPAAPMASGQQPQKGQV